MIFHDRATLDVKTKRLIAMRDGVLEYLGEEIGRHPADQVFTVYRSPATLANAARHMDGLPIINGHVQPHGEPPESDSHILDTNVVDMRNEDTLTYVATAHNAQIDQVLDAAIESGRREVSVGYTGDLVEHEVYGLEQINIKPHHVAIEEAGRCGPECSFIDHRKPTVDGDTMFRKNEQKKTHQAFLDEDGNVNMQQIVEIASALPEAIKTVPVDKLQEVMPQLQELIALAQDVGSGESPSGEGDESTTDTDDIPSDENEEEEMDDKAIKGKDKKPSDANGYTDAQVSKFVDTQVKQAVKNHAYVINKARNFLDESYDFADKSTEEIMRDAIATETTESFTDRELPLAFKMLVPSASREEVTSFGDRNPDQASKFETIADKEL